MKRWQPYAALGISLVAALSAASGCELIATADRSLIDAVGAGGGQGGAGGAGGEQPTTSSGGMGGMAGMGGGGGTLLTNGSPCMAGGECNSGFCVDGVCCDTACDGTCVACTAALQGGGSDGTCGPIAVGSDPEDECDDETATNACGRTGNCDGDGFCEVVAALTSCGDVAGCSSGVQTGADLCDGSGSCVQGNDVTCDPYVCDAAGTMCLTMCTTSADCLSTHFCGGVACFPKSANGTACQNADQCQSGFCVDGYCCDTACDTTCRACSMAKKGVGNNGVCGQIAAGTDPDSECGTECMVSNCNQAGACSAPQQAPDTTPCGMGMMCQGGVCQ